MVTAHHRHRARGLSAILVALASASGLAIAATPYAVSFAGGGGCPREDEVRADVAAHVHDASRTSGARVELRVAGAVGRVTGELVVTDAAGKTGRREIEGASCPEVAHALAFLAGMALELGGRLDAPAGPAPAAPPPPAAPVMSTLWVPERSGPTFASLAALGVRGGIGPGLSPAGEIGAELISSRPGAFAPAAGATAVIGHGHLDGDGARLNLLLVGVRLQVCPWRIGRGRLEGRPCAAAEGGSVRATGEGSASGGSDSSGWVAGEAALHARWWVTPELFVDVGVGAVFPAVRRQYGLPRSGGGSTYAVPPVTGRLVIAAGLRL
jgi:hypothetical protein